MPFGGIRFRVTVTAVLVFAVALTIASVVLTTILRRSLVDEVDRSIDSRAADIISQIESTGLVFDLGIGLEGDTMAAVVGEDGFVYTSTDPSVSGSLLEASFDDYEVPVTVDLGDLDETQGSRNMRAIALFSPGETADEDNVFAYVATSLDGVDRTVRTATRGALVISSVLLVVAGGLVWVMVGRALRPVDDIRAEVDEITASDLHRRVPQPASNDEVARLAATMNMTLEGLESAQRQQRRFVADASHELRSPLGAMAARLDVALEHPEHESWQETAVSLRGDTDRMRRLVDDLLFLACSDNPQPSRRQDLVDLDDLVFEVVAAASPPSGIEIDTSHVSAGLVRGDGDQLRRMITNLVDNALRHARSVVTVELTEPSGAVELTIDDDGAGIDPLDRARIFERFVRLDDARSRDLGGSGLGLAICREVATAHGGAITAATSPLGGARFAVQLPVVPT